ncbi:MAG: hypothetical protein ACI9UN_001308 [Granulosicoccus sp.]|jgi:hypothetical protein
MRAPTNYKKTTKPVQPNSWAEPTFSLNDFGPFQTHLLIGIYCREIKADIGWHNHSVDSVVTSVISPLSAMEARSHLYRPQLRSTFRYAEVKNRPKRLNRTIVGYLNHAKKDLNPVNFVPQVLTSVGVGK